MDQPFPAYRGDDPYVFVCYAHDDNGIVFPEIQWLRDQGVNLWYDEGISAGKVWRAEIAEAIQGAAKFLYYISAASLASVHCNREVNYALDRGFEVLPVYLEEVDLTPELDLALNRVQALHRDQDASYQQHLLNALGQSAPGRSERPAIPAQAVRTPLSNRGRLALAVLAVTLLAVIASQGWDRTPAGPPATSIAVLPFEDMSPGGDQQWLANGMTEALVVYLSRIEDFRVTEAPASDETAQDAKSIGAQRAVGSVVRGSVRRSGDELIVTARMARASDGAELWSARYDRAIDDVFEVQKEIARAIVGAIEAELGIELPPGFIDAFNEARYSASDVRAYELWRKALDLKFSNNNSPNEQDLNQALQYNLEAVAIDPDFAMGYVGLGTTYQRLGFHTKDPRDRKAATAAFERAVELDSLNTFARASLVTSYGATRRWGDVIRQVEHVEPWTRVADIPGAVIWYIQAMVNLGRWDDADAAVDELGRAFETSPDRYPAALVELAHALVLVRGDYEAAIAVMERYPYQLRGWGAQLFAYIYHAAGRDQKAVEAFLIGLTDEERELAKRAYAERGWLEMLRAVVARRGRPMCESTTEMYAALGESEMMYGCLEGGLEVYECLRAIDPDQAHKCLAGGLKPFLTPMWTAPPFEAYLEEPRFQAILDGSGVVGYKNVPAR